MIYTHVTAYPTKIELLGSQQRREKNIIGNRK